MKRALVWMVWSPRNAVVTVAVVAMVVGGLVAVSATGGGDDAPARPVSVVTDTPTTATTAVPADEPTTPTPNTTATATAPAPTVGTEKDRKAAHPDKAAADARAAADAFLAAWLKGRTTKHDAWVKSMQPLVVPAFLSFIAMTPAKAIPDTTVKSIGKATPDMDYATVAAELGNGMKLTIEVSVWDGKWRVANVDETR